MIVAYLSFDGQTEEAFNFYSSALGGKIDSIQRFADMPGGENAPPMSDADKKKIMHISMTTADGSKLMGNDHLDFMGEKFEKGNNMSLSIHPKSKELADKAFNALSQGGQVIVPMATAPWGDYFGMFIDRFGIKWMINYSAAN